MKNVMKPLTKSKLTIPIWESIVNSRLLAPGSYNLDVTNFSIANTTPSFPRRPITVLENMSKNYCIQQLRDQNMKRDIKRQIYA